MGRHAQEKGRGGNESSLPRDLRAGHAMVEVELDLISDPPVVDVGSPIEHRLSLGGRWKGDEGGQEKGGTGKDEALWLLHECSTGAGKRN